MSGRTVLGFSKAGLPASGAYCARSFALSIRQWPVPRRYAAISPLLQSCDTLARPSRRSLAASVVVNSSVIFCRFSYGCFGERLQNSICLALCQTNPRNRILCRKRGSGMVRDISVFTIWRSVYRRQTYRGLNMTEVEVFMIAYDGGNGRIWWRRGLNRKTAARVVHRLQKAGLNPVLVIATVEAEHLMDVATTLSASRP